ncbi:unnamed protein product [Allacma fusca]|uniref:DNA 5'-3' helicase n=1 Tax=Allacma fusca TaxID=39272 RepID=A0A8J2JX19_9HEXA|nr:unnamed protein product [Allacma fusca]
MGRGIRFWCTRTPRESLDRTYSTDTIENKSCVTFNDLRDQVYNEISEHEQVAGVKWKRFAQLNKLLQGHRPGELTVLTGPTGSGKTTFVSEYSLDLCMQGVKTFWGSFEIRNERLAKTMLTQFAGKRLENSIDEFDYWADEFNKLPLYFMTFHGPQSFKQVLQAMRVTSKKYDIEHVVIDNLQFMLGTGENGGQHDRFWQQDIVIGAFRKFCNERNCHVTLVVHPRKEQSEGDLTNSSIFGGVKVTQEADNILILQDRRLTTPKGKKYLQVTKNRFSGDLGMFPIEFDKERLCFSSQRKASSVSAKISDLKFEGL